MNDPTLFGLAVIPSIIGLVQVLKELGLPDRAAPAAAVLLGILAGIAQQYATHTSWAPAVAGGLALGLSSVGLHAGTKATVIAKTDGRTEGIILPGSTAAKVTDPIPSPWAGSAPEGSTKGQR